jgi:excisionase family DNA binding protein
MHGNSSRLLDVDEVAARVGVARRTVWGWISDGSLPVVKLGSRLVRIAERDLERFVEERRERRGRA